MPWRETCQMDERTQFIARVLAGEDEMTALCREYGISRKTGYKWLWRYRGEGVAGLRERSHAAVRHGQAHDVAVVQAVLGLRERWGWGPKKLRVKLGALHPELAVPAASTIGDWLRREGLVGRSRRRRRCPAYAQPFAAVTAANDVWCTDFKGWFRTTDGRRCDPFTLTDAHSRYLLRCRAVARMRRACGRSSRRPFRSTGCRGRSVRTMARLSLRPGWADCRVGGLVDQARHPPSGSSPASRSRMGGTSGFIARSTRTPRCRRPNSFRRVPCRLQQRAAARSAGTEDAGFVVRSLAAAYPDRLTDPSYAADVAIRRVRSNGQIKWAGELIFVGEALIGEPVGVVETEGGDWLVRYAEVELGYIHPQRRRLSPRPLHSVRRPGDLMDIAAAIPTTPQAHQPQQP